MPSILVLGDINIDVLMGVPTYPPRGGEALTERVDTRLGGSAANAAVVLSRLGLEARMLARVGGDAWGQVALASLADAGVGLELVQHDSIETTGLMFTVVTPDGERTMFGQRGANCNTDPAAITPDTFGGVGHLYLSGYALLELPQREAALRAVELATERNLPISLDTAYLPALDAPQALRQLLPYLDSLHPRPGGSTCPGGRGRAPCRGGCPAQSWRSIGCVEAWCAGLPAGGCRFHPLCPGLPGPGGRYNRRR